MLSECSERPYFERKRILSVQLCLSTFFALGLENDEDNVCGEISENNNFWRDNVHPKLQSGGGSL